MMSASSSTVSTLWKDTADVRRIYSGSASSAACPVSPLQTSFLPGFLLS